MNAPTDPAPPVKDKRVTCARCGEALPNCACAPQHPDVLYSLQHHRKRTPIFGEPRGDEWT